MAKLTANDFREVKAMLKSGWDDATIMSRTDWSAHTVRRIRTSGTFVAYRLQVHNETSTIRDRRQAEQQARDGLIDETLSGPEFADKAKLRPARSVNKIKGLRRFLPW